MLVVDRIPLTKVGKVFEPVLRVDAARVRDLLGHYAFTTPDVL
ncbi:hypothetical protein [Candidatus Frankia alpina]|nr:hypothetical protein [Candidatus Frankia alpina]